MKDQDYAKRICGVTQEELENFRLQLSEAGLKWSNPELVYWDKNPEELTSELRVEFFYEGDLVDIFEFFIFYKGIVEVSEEEVRQWTRTNIPDILKKQAKRVSRGGTVS